MSQSDYVKKLEAMLSAYTDSFGFCSFESLKGRLINCRALNRIPQNAQGVITVLFPYYLGEEKYKNSNISRYACVTDYHSVALGVLNEVCRALRNEWQDEKFEPFVDNSPIPEVYAAALSSLGKIGTNGLLINEKYGTWVFIGEIVTTLSLENSTKVQYCENCGACERACPTGAIADGRVDKSLCLSDITQRKGELSDEQCAMIKQSGCAWGCDICQLVCPHNNDVKATGIDDFISSFSPRADTENLENKAYGWHGKGVIQRNIKLLEE